MPAKKNCFLLRLMKLKIKYILLLVSLITLSGCAALYHVQVSDIETTNRGRIIDIKLSETGVDVKGMMGTASAAARIRHNRVGTEGSRQTAEGLEILELIYAISNMGPRTGIPVFTDKYADILLDKVIGECPSGKITGLMSVREARNYPYISGEIVNVRGYCVD